MVNESCHIEPVKRAQEEPCKAIKTEHWILEVFPLKRHNQEADRQTV